MPTLAREKAAHQNGAPGFLGAPVFVAEFLAEKFWKPG
jgi:hypothetical protein